MEARWALRRMMRRKRAALSRDERQRAAKGVARQINAALMLHPGKRVAVYWAIGGEVSTRYLIEGCRRAQCTIFLPRITHAGRASMEFVELTAGATLRTRRLGIAEPAALTRTLRPLELDLVFVPLLAFDRAGNRLGMGAGFYDRCFKRLRHGGRWRKPKLIGVAYELQRAVDGIESQPWDVPLDAVVTEKRIYWMKSLR